MIRFSRVNHKLQVITIFAVYLIIILATRNSVLVPGRLFAEEGSIWWAHSINADFGSILFFVSPMTGYFLLNCNLIMLIAKFFPIFFVPTLVTWISFLAQAQIALIFLLPA